MFSRRFTDWRQSPASFSERRFSTLNMKLWQRLKSRNVMAWLMGAALILYLMYGIYFTQLDEDLKKSRAVSKDLNQGLPVDYANRLFSRESPENETGRNWDVRFGANLKKSDSGFYLHEISKKNAENEQVSYGQDKNWDRPKNVAKLSQMSRRQDEGSQNVILNPGKYGYASDALRNAPLEDSDKSKPMGPSLEDQNFTSEFKNKSNFGDATGTHTRVCLKTPVVVCGEDKIRKNSQHISNSTNIRITRQKNRIITSHIDTGATYVRFLTPIKIGIVNLPEWMRNEYIHIKRRLKNTLSCIFDDGPITNETQIVGVVAPGLKEGHKPPQRWPGQIYVLMGWETPDHFSSSITQDISTWDGAFNSTMSYRLDSDIIHTYGQLIYTPIPSSQLPNYMDISAKKKHQVVWIVSNCKTPSNRESYVEEMKKYIDIDIFGACGEDIACPWSGDLKCAENVILQYRFYLSFENSICPDYVTEKLFKVYSDNKHIVPVVRGGAPYNHLFPANTYINAADFDSPKELALFLLNMDTQTYSNYLATKDLYTRWVGTDYILDELCNAFTKRETKVSRPDVKQWLRNYHCVGSKRY